MNLPEIFVCARRAPVASAVVSVYFVQASRERAKREAEELLANAERRASPRRFLTQPEIPSAFGGLK